MKKILFIINTYTNGGGAEDLLGTIVNHLNPQKYEISIMEILHHDIKVPPTNPEVTVLPYIMRADDPERKSKMYYVYHEPELVFKNHVKEEYDLYVSFNYQKPTFLLPAGKKDIAWIHSDVYNLTDASKTEERQLQDEAFEKVRKIVSISDITTQSLKDVFPRHTDKIVEIYNGLDIDYVKSKAKESTDICLEHPALLFMGRMEERKNPLRLVNVLEGIHRKHQRVHLYYMGFGPLVEAAKELAEGKGLADYVHFIEYQNNPFPIIAQCDISCLLSKSEGFPMFLLESVALDKPFVATVIGGARVLANNQRCGRTIETDEEAVDAVLELLAVNPETIAAKCREAIQRFELNRYINRIEELFDSILEGVQAE